MPKTIARIPAFTIIEPDPQPVYREGAVIIIAEMTADHGELFHRYAFQSILGVALAACADPIAAYRRAMSAGEPTHWLVPQAPSILSVRQSGLALPYHRWGDHVRFHGRVWELTHTLSADGFLVLVETNPTLLVYRDEHGKLSGILNVGANYDPEPGGQP